MKKLLLLCCIQACLGFSLRANPIGEAFPAISELMFYPDGSWIVEIEIQGYTDMDNIFLISSTGKAQVKTDFYNKINGHIYLTVSSDSLYSPLTINQLGDSLQIAQYYGEYEDTLYEPLIFGDYDGATIRAPKEGESLARIENLGPFCICNYTSIGYPNPVIGMLGKIYGTIYDVNKKPISFPDLLFKAAYVDIYSQEDGSYHSVVYTFSQSIDKLWYRKKDAYEHDYNAYTVIDISPIDFFLEPEQSQLIDIYLLEEIIYEDSGVEDIDSDNSLFRIYPNPVKDGILYFETELPVKSSSCFIELIDISGKKMGEYPITDNKGELNLPANPAKGTYIVNFYANGQKYTSTKLIIAP